MNAKAMLQYLDQEGHLVDNRGLAFAVKVVDAKYEFGGVRLLVESTTSPVIENQAWVDLASVSFPEDEDEAESEAA